MGRTTVALGACIAAQLACGGGAASQSETPGMSPAPASAASARRSSTTLVPEDLSADDRATLTVFQSIQKYRPRFLSGAGYSKSNSPNSPIVLYVDDVKMPGLDLLTQLRMTDVERIQYLTGAQGTMRFGMGHDSGVLLLTRRK